MVNSRIWHSYDCLWYSYKIVVVPNFRHNTRACIDNNRGADWEKNMPFKNKTAVQGIQANHARGGLKQKTEKRDEKSPSISWRFF